MNHYNIVFIGYGILGDFIVCLKSLELIREAYPIANITFIGNKAFARLGLNDYHINQIIEPDDDFKKYYTEKDFLSDKWDSVFDGANILVNHLMDANGIFVYNMQNKGFNHLTSPEPNFDLNKHTKVYLHGEVQNEENSAYEQVAELLLNIGISTDNWVPYLRLPEPANVKAEKIINKIKKEHNIDKLIAFHPGASSDYKLMPIAIWAEAIKESFSSEIYIIVFSGPAEESMLAEVKIELADLNYISIHNEDLRYAAALLSHCDVFLGHDTGFAHIASALNVKSLLIFGQTSLPYVWAPPTHRTTTIVADNIKSPDLTPIIESIKTICCLSNITSKLYDIHTHYGPYGDFDFSPEEVVRKMKNIGLRGIGIMQAPMKDDNYMPDNHKLLKVVELSGGELEIIPILMTSPAMVENDPTFTDVKNIPYKIIKIHPHAHNWSVYPDLIETILNHAKASFLPVMIHSGYDESEPKNFESWFKKHPEIQFILAHGKPSDQAFEMIRKYKNVWIDISFMDEVGLSLLISDSGIEDRILFGTDMPVNELFYDMTSEEFLHKRLLMLKNLLKEDFFRVLSKWGSTNITHLLMDVRKKH